MDNNISHQHGLVFNRTWLLVILLALGAYDLGYLTTWWLSRPEPPFSDFFGLWSFGRYVRQAGAAVYDPVALSAYQHILDPDFHEAYPCFYPPPLFLVLIPLGLAPLPVAYAVWIATSFALYLAATVGKKPCWLSVLALCVAPTTLLTIVAGQNGFLSAALLVGGLRNLTSRPVIGGVLLGLLSYKPTLALLLPIILIASRNWRTIGAGCLTFIAMVIMSSLVIGWAIWPAWLSSLPLQEEILRGNLPAMAHIIPGFPAGAYSIGLPVSAGYAAQIMVSAVVVVLTWKAFRRGVTDGAIAMAVLGSVIVAPHVVIYDLPMVAAAIAIYWQALARRGVPFTLGNSGHVAILFAAILAMVAHSVPFVVSALLFLTFLQVAYRFDLLSER